MTHTATDLITALYTATDTALSETPPEAVARKYGQPVETARFLIKAELHRRSASKSSAKRRETGLLI